MNPVVVLFSLAMAWAFIICALILPVELTGERSVLRLLTRRATLL